tara:strand:- start:1634 stop:2590 length:957 start_codon:yes stop_codon:yes gene_type:complete
MKISVAIASYNGQKYIEEQIQSILNQSVLPNEIVVSDDNSNDKTIEILKLIKEKSKININIIQNSLNKGYTKNFERAVKRCSGDLILLSDQDDYWLPEKIKTIVSEFKLSKLFLYLNNTLISDEFLKSTEISKLDQVISLYGNSDNFVPGCCMSIDNKLKNIFLPFPSDLMSYDQWINFVSISINSKKIIEESLQYYRLHKNNTSSFEANNLKKLNFYHYLKNIFRRIKNNSKDIELSKQIECAKIVLNRLKLFKNQIENFNKLYISCKKKIISLKFRDKMIKSNFFKKCILLLKYFISKDLKLHLTYKNVLSDFLRF